MVDTGQVRSACGFCAAGCGILITMKEGKPCEVKGDPEHPFNRGALCPHGRAGLEYIDHPDRLKQPLKRIGSRGQGSFKEISWDEAFQLTGDALNRIRQEHGAEAVFMAHGSAKGLIDTHLVRLANAFGTPNLVCSDHVCHIPTSLAAEMTFGYFPRGEYNHPPDCILVWGCNPAASRPMMHRMLSGAGRKGSKFIVIDPLKIDLAKKADLWVQVRPGTDLALALGMLHVIVEEELYDKDFVEKWTVGFEKLKLHVLDYTPEKVSEITWVPKDLIVRAALEYATSRSSHVVWGNALDHNINSFQTARAISILMAVTGNLGIPGGEIETMPSGFRFSDPWGPEMGIHGRWSSELELRDLLSDEKRMRKVGGYTNSISDFRYVTPQAVIKSILESDPYKIRGGYVQATNPLSSWCDIHRTRAAMESLEFFAVSDLIMTPTAMLADIVFPSAISLEYDGIVKAIFGPGAHFHQKVAQTGDCKSDHDIVIGLAKSMGLEKYFWHDAAGFWDTVLEPSGITFEKFKEVKRFPLEKPKPAEYRRYKRFGFNTPSKKVEIFSEELKQQGVDPLPVYRECPETPVSEPKLAEKYPLIATTRKLNAYRHSSGRQIAGLRKRRPDPLVMIHPKTAHALSIEEGDWVFIENKRGKIKQKAALSTNIDPRVVMIDHGWWFPEMGQKDMFGWALSNDNVLTNCEPPFSRETGAFDIRGFICRVFKAP